jgi:gliding motility-associated lipoprotein GldD
MNKVAIVSLSAVLFLLACGGNADYVPKQHGYPRLYLPEKHYVVFDTPFCPYAFEIPVYAKMEKDTVSNYTPQPTWFNLNFKPFGATLHITHYNFKNWNAYDSLVMDTRKLVNKHLQRADDILEENIANINPKMKGIVFRIDGNTATNYNFYITDSSRNFFRGALYFNSQTSQDSIAPAYEFVKQDLEHLIKTFQWK